MLGEAGLTKLAALNHATASRLADRIGAIPGVTLLNETLFNEFTLALPKPAAAGKPSPDRGSGNDEWAEF